MDKVRLGIIGMGRMGLTHFSIINTHHSIEITALADSSGVILDMMKKYMPEITMFSDYNDLLNSGLVDAIIVCTPSALHFPICKLACEKGIHVFCEKPFTTDPQKAEELAKMFEEKGLVNQVGYVYRFDPVFKTVKKFLDSGLIGKVAHVSAQFLSATISKTAPEKGWRSKRENGGGCTYEMGSHIIDLMDFFFGAPDKVAGSQTGHVYSELVEDICDVQLLYQNGIPVDIHVNWSDYSYRKPMMKLDIHGTKGKILADLYGYRIYLREADPASGLEQGWTTVPMNMIPDPTPYYVRGTSFTNQLYSFADSILQSKKATGCSFRSAGDTQRVIHTIFSNESK